MQLEAGESSRLRTVIQRYKQYTLTSYTEIGTMYVLVIRRDYCMLLDDCNSSDKATSTRDVQFKYITMNNIAYLILKQ